MHRVTIRATAMAIMAVLAALLLGTPSQFSSGAAAATTPSTYVQAVLADNPVAFLQGTVDLTGNGSAGTTVGSPTSTTLPNGDPALAFDGRGEYLQFADRKAFEVDATGVLTVEFWMRPDTLQFADEEGSGYVYTMGKGKTGEHEWYTRMYSKTNDESRPNRISGYVFNPAGGLGAGSYFQDPVTVGQWIHVALVINSKATSTQYPMGYTRTYKNGVLRDTDSLQDYDIVPRSGTAPLRIGTGYLNSFFEGAIGNVAFFNKELSANQINTHYTAVSAPAPTVTTWSRALDGTNVRRDTDELIRYTPKYGTSTRTNVYGFEARVVDGEIKAVRDGEGDMRIPSKGYVLSGHGDARQWLLEHATVGTTVTIASGRVTLSAPVTE